MQVRCPSCDRPLEIAAPESSRVLGNILNSLSSVQCPDCGLVAIDSNDGLTRSLPATILQTPPHAVAHFTLLRVLGQGGFGEVWLARDNNLAREVALKLPATQGPEMASLLYEAKTAASLRHPHIVSVYEVGTDHERIFIASEYIDGVTLRDFLTAGRPNRSRAIRLIGVTARALHYAHQRGVVHRDVKPANILIDKEGEPHITDFGIAKRISADATISSEGQVIGTAKYMAPEQAAGKSRETDHRADIYALGVVLYEMLAGDVPFRGNVQAILHQKMTEDAPSPRTMAPGLSRDLETICLKCLERDPGKRYASALEVAEELERVAGGEPIRARPITSLERAWRWCRKRPDVSGLLAGLFLTLTIGLAISSILWRRAEANRQRAEDNWTTSETNRRLSEENRLRAEQIADSLRRSLYRARMNQVAIHHSNGDFGTVRTLLDELARDPLVRPLIGFEWHFYAGQAELVRTVANHGSIVEDVAISREGDLCASIVKGPDKTIKVWDAATGELVRTLEVETGRFECLEFSPTDGRLASGSNNGMVRIWNPRQDARIDVEVKHGLGVKRVRFSPDGKRLLSFSDRGGIRVWNSADLSVVDQYPGGESIQDVRFLPDGSGLVSAVGNGQVRVWTLGSKQPRAPREIHPHIQAMAVSDDGQLLIAGDYQGGLNLCPLEGEGESERLQMTWGRIDSIEMIPRTGCVAVSGSDGRLHLFDFVRRRLLNEVETHHLGVGMVARSANGQRLATGSTDGSISVIKVQELLAPVILWHDAPVRELAFLPDGTRLLAADNSGLLRIWDLSNGESRPPPDEDALPTRTIAVQKSTGLVATGGGAPVAAVRDVETLAVQHRIAVPASGVTLARWSPTGRYLALALFDGPVQLYRAGEWNQPAQRFTCDDAKGVALDFAPDDETLAIGWDDGNVELLHSGRGEPAGKLTLLPAAPTAVAWCDRGRRLAIALEDGQISIWDVAAGTVRHRIRAHTGQIRTIAVLPGEQTLATGGLDRDLKLWDVESGELVTMLPGHDRRIFTIAISPDGRTLASGALDGDIRLWRGR